MKNNEKTGKEKELNRRKVAKNLASQRSRWGHWDETPKKGLAPELFEMKRYQEDMKGLAESYA